MSTQSTWLTELRVEQFDEFLKVLWASLREVATDLPDEIVEGVGELSADPWPIGYAVDKSLRFAAFQWHCRDLDAPQSVDLRVESFFICPASSSPRACLRITSSNPASSLQKTPLWWGEQLKFSSTQYLGTGLPSFLELAAILASNGHVTTTSAEAQAVVSDLRFELDYFKQLVEEQAEDLRQTRAKLRDQRVAAPLPASEFDDGLEESVPEPISDLSGLPAWALQNSGRITLLPRALQGAKKSLYENPSAVYSALELLAGPYREHRQGMMDKAGFSQLLAEAGFQLAGSATPTTAGEQGNSYYVNWQGRRRFLEFHLLKGGGRDERYCLRIYFFWDDETKQAVVGWLPSHLNNSLT